MIVTSLGPLIRWSSTSRSHDEPGGQAREGEQTQRDRDDAPRGREAVGHTSVLHDLDAAADEAAELLELVEVGPQRVALGGESVEADVELVELLEDLGELAEAAGQPLATFDRVAPSGAEAAEALAGDVELDLELTTQLALAGFLPLGFGCVDAGLELAVRAVRGLDALAEHGALLGPHRLDLRGQAAHERARLDGGTRRVRVVDQRVAVELRLAEAHVGAGGRDRLVEPGEVDDDGEQFALRVVAGGGLRVDAVVAEDAAAAQRQVLDLVVEVVDQAADEVELLGSARAGSLVGAGNEDLDEQAGEPGGVLRLTPVHRDREVVGLGDGRGADAFFEVLDGVGDVHRAALFELRTPARGLGLQLGVADDAFEQVERLEVLKARRDVDVGLVLAELRLRGRQVDADRLGFEHRFTAEARCRQAPGVESALADQAPEHRRDDQHPCVLLDELDGVDARRKRRGSAARGGAL
jgi:hypothetical protein